MTVQAGLCQTWSEPQIVGFLTHMLILYLLNMCLTLSVLTSLPAEVYTDIIGLTEAAMFGLLLSSLIKAVKYNKIISEN